MSWRFLLYIREQPVAAVNELKKKLIGILSAEEYVRPQGILFRHPKMKYG